MDTFIRQVAQHTQNKYGKDLHHVWVVLPNQRATVYLKKALGELYGSTLFAPRILSMLNLAHELTGIQPLSQIELLTRLYNVHDKVMRGAGLKDEEEGFCPVLFLG